MHSDVLISRERAMLLLMIIISSSKSFIMKTYPLPKKKLTTFSIDMIKRVAIQYQERTKED